MLLLVLLLAIQALPVQAQDEPVPDSVEVILDVVPPPDSTAEAESPPPILITTAMDSLDAPKRRLPRGHTPKRVLSRALLVPGWGQIYNRQYFRAAIYYAGLGSAGYLVFSANENYLLFRHAALYAEYRDVAVDERPDQYRDSFVSDYEEVLRDVFELTPAEDASEEAQSDRARLATTLRSQRDIFRRRRDLNILLTFGIWGLGVIESFVSAHLIHFDVSEDLTFHVVPTPRGTSATMTFTF